MLGPNEIYPYQRVKENQETMGWDREKIWKGLGWLLRQWVRPRALLTFAIAFLLARAVVAEQLAPFGIAFLIAISVRYQPLILPVAIITIIGESSTGLIEPFWLNPLTYIILILLKNFLGNRRASFLRLSLATVLGIFLIKAGLSYIFLQPVTYDYILIALEGLIAGALLPSYLVIVRVIQKPRENFGRLQEEMGSILFLILGILLGLNFSIAGYNPSVVISKYIVMFAAFMGAGWGASFGVACGLIPGLSQFNGLLLIGLYSLSGMLAGLLKHWGKIGILLGFFCGNLFYGFYFNDQVFLTGFLETSGLAAFLLLFTPKKLIDNLSVRWQKTKEKNKGLPASIEDGLKGLINLFETLSIKYTQTAVAIEEDQGKEKLLKSTINKVCIDCSMSRICWEHEGHLLYGYLFEWLTELEMDRTEYPEELMPMELKKRCRRPVELATTLSYLLAVDTANGFWQRKMIKERKAVATQLKSTIKILEKARKEWEVIPKRCEDVEETLLLELEGLNLFPEKLEVWANEEQGLEIYLELETPRRKGTNYTDIIISAFTDSLDLPVLLKKQYFSGLGSIETVCLRLTAIKKNKPEIGFAKLAKNGSEVSGDSILVSGLSQSRWLFLLSDGMGSGEKAFQESSSLVLLLEQFLTLGFSLKEAIEMLNTLIFIEGSESFATIDLFLLDLEKEHLEFVKIGAAPSLLITDDKCAVLEASSFPMGVVEDITPETVSLALEPGAVLIMVSDGIWQGTKKDYKEGWLPNFIEGVWQLEPQKLANRILEHANILHRGKAEDDLTVMVIKIAKD